MHTKIPLSLFAFTGPFLTTPAPEVPLTITAPPHTDLWRKPGLPKAHSFPSFSAPLALSEFHSASVTFHANWKTLYDQGGISFIFPAAQNSTDDHPPRWIKAGIEFVDNVPRVSIVAANIGSWADWTLAGGPEGMGLNSQNVTLEMVREGPSLVVNIAEGEKKSTVREITWVFEDGLLEEDPKVLVGAYAAKPTPEEGDRAGDGVDVVFEQVEVRKNSSCG